MVQCSNDVDIYRLDQTSEPHLFHSYTVLITIYVYICEKENGGFTGMYVLFCCYNARHSMVHYRKPGWVIAFYISIEKCLKWLRMIEYHLKDVEVHSYRALFSSKFLPHFQDNCTRRTLFFSAVKFSIKLYYFYYSTNVSAMRQVWHTQSILILTNTTEYLITA